MPVSAVELEFDRVAHRTDSATAFHVGDYDDDEDEIWLWVPNTLLVDVNEEEGVIKVPEYWAIQKGLV